MPGLKNEAATLLRGGFISKFGFVSVLRCLAGHPIPEVKVLPDFSAFVTVLLWFFWLIIHFGEWMFGISNCLTDDFQRFGHSLMSFCQV